MQYRHPCAHRCHALAPWTSQPTCLAACVRAGAKFGDCTAGQKLSSDDPIRLLLRAKSASETVRGAPAASPSPAVHSAAAPAPLAPSNQLPVQLPVRRRAHLLAGAPVGTWCRVQAASAPKRSRLPLPASVSAPPGVAMLPPYRRGCAGRLRRRRCAPDAHLRTRRMCARIAVFSLLCRACV